jgi:hypothetical protein
MTALSNRKRGNYLLERFKGSDGDFYWRQTDRRNGEVVGSASEGYSRAIDCLHNLFVVTGWHTFDTDCVGVTEPSTVP